MDLNSKYAYFLLCDHFAQSSIVCRDISDQEQVVGFIGGYRKPAEPETLFVWQIAVDEKYRGHGLSHMMLDRLLQVHNPVSVKSVEATYTPSNKASYNFFSKFAENKKALVKVDEYLSDKHFGEGNDAHEAEQLIKIFLTPMPSNNNKEK